MKKTILLLFLFLSISAVARKPLKKRKHMVNKALKEIVTNPDFRTAGFGFLAVDVNTGEVIAEYNPDMALRPASTLKLLSTATALELLRPGFRFTTILEYTGEIDTVNHVLSGDIIIKGGGDPTPGSKYFDETNPELLFSHWLQAVKNLGIDSVSGSVIADAGFFSRDMVPPSWSWQNMGNYFGAGACGLTIEDNAYSVYFDTQVRAGDTVKFLGVSPTIPGLKIENRVVADSINYDNSVIFGAPYCYQRYITGQLPAGRARFRVKGSVPDPAFIAAWQLDSVLNVSGIKIAGNPSTVRILSKKSGTYIYQGVSFDTLFSPPLTDIVAQTNIHSINLFAEHCALMAGVQLGAEPRITIVMDSIKSFWAQKGMDVQGMRLTDGSGLSQYDVVSPGQMVFLLSYMKQQSRWFDDFYQSLAVGGESGTLENMFYGTAAQNNVHAKSGTIAGAKTYTGYVTTKSGREVAFSMMVNNYSCPTREAKAKLEYLMVKLAEFDK